MYDLTRFGLREMTSCGVALREAGDGAASMEEVANRIVRHLYDGLTTGPPGSRASVLVRFYKTHDYGDLEPALRALADRSLDDRVAAPGMKCLTLLATIGDETAWNRRTASEHHQAIPLPSADVVARLPMVAQLVRQFGMGVSDLVELRPALLVELKEKNFNVFHVADAAGSPHVPAQDSFVGPYGVKSVLGFGGLLPPGDLFAIIIFSRIPIDRETASLFQTLALSAKLALLPFSQGPVFAPAALGATP